MITFATGCSGIGAPEAAWHDRLGWKPLWCSEIEPFPSAVLKHHWPDVPNVGDFMAIAGKIDRDELEAPDVFCAGTPCQAFSVAGLRNSLNDHRGGLTLEYIRIADAMDAQRKRRGLPETVFVWENVPGVFSTKDNAFGCFLGGMLGLDAPVVPAGGKWRHYGDLVAKRRLAWRLLDAQYFRVAQRRRRVFVVATARPGVRPARALFELGCVPRTAPPSREAWAGSPSEAQRSARTASYGIGNGQADSAMNMQEELSQTLHCMHDPNAVMCAPITARFMGGQGEKAGGLGYGEELAPTLKGAPSGSNQVPDVLCVDKHMCSGIDRVPALEREGAHNVVISQYGDIAGAVTARNDSSPCADRGPTVVCYENNPTDARQKETDVSPSVLARWGTGGNQTPLVQEVICRATQQANAETLKECDPTLTEAAGTSGNNVPLCYSISENVIDRKPQNGGHHLGVSDGPQFTLDTAGVHGVAASGFVRRLTTVECARLQGFPDHHTEIPWRGKPASDCPNGPQYKAYGNSMCVNVMEWLGRKIQGEIYANSTSKMA